MKSAHQTARDRQRDPKARLFLAVVTSSARDRFKIVPLKSQSKRPATEHGVYDAISSPSRVRRYFETHPTANYGIATGHASNVVVVDIDGRRGRRLLKRLEAKHGALPKTAKVRTARGWHLYLALPAKAGRIGNGSFGRGLDFKGDGGYVVGPLSTHPSGSTYRVEGGTFLDRKNMAEAPGWLLKMVVRPDPVSVDQPAKSTAIADPVRAAAYYRKVHDKELALLSSAPNHQRNNTLNRTAFRLAQFLYLGVADRTHLADELTGVGVRLGLSPEEASRTTASGLAAGERSPAIISSKGRLHLHDPAEPDRAALAKELSALGETDTDNARRFISRFGGQVAFHPGLGWLVWSGSRWCTEGDRGLHALAILCAEAIAEEAAYLEGDQTRRIKHAQLSKASASIARMLQLAQHMALVEAAAIDRYPRLLNVKNGVVDLATGKRLPHDSRRLMTKIAATTYDRKADAPIFCRFLDRATGGDESYQRYLQQAAGYSLLGEVSAQVFFYAFGQGATGKSTLVNVLRELLGDYGQHTPIETLLARHFDNAIPNDLARLAGSRFVTAIEPNFNRHLDEGRIKAMTGGDPITARFLHREFFEFTPQFTLWVVANDFPRVRGTADAFWRRVRVLPFDVVIPEAERDPGLPEKLRAEWPGILAWAVQGCVAWLKDGFIKCSKVKGASKAWQVAADHLGRFLAEECAVDTIGSVQALQLYDHYLSWCRAQGEKSLTATQFKTQLIAKGHIWKKTKRWREWRGLKLRSSD
jgi:putative DNA primase/helicase